jgi:hypothetical protein
MTRKQVRSAGVAWCGIHLVSVVTWTAPTPQIPATQPKSSQLCGAEGRSLPELARILDALGETGRTALMSLSQSPEKGEVLCGLRGLAALGDTRAVPVLVEALKQPAFRDDAYLLARWAAYLAGASPAGDGVAMEPVVEVFSNRVVWDSAGLDSILLLGEIDHPSARERLLSELDKTADDAALDAVVHALARQGEPRARERIAALGDEAARAKSGNATPEQARRLAEVAFYQLTLGPETLDAGLATLGTIALRDQEWTASWAAHTLCARAVRRPDDRAAIDAHRQSLVTELDARGIDWRAPKGAIGCGTPGP